MQDLTKYCPKCKEWVFHLQGLCPKCHYIFPQTPPNQEEHEELEPTYENKIHQFPQIDNSFDEEEEESVWEKYAPWNEWKLNPWDKHPWEWNPWENTNNDTLNNDSWNSDPFNNDPWNNN